MYEQHSFRILGQVGTLTPCIAHDFIYASLYQMSTKLILVIRSRSGNFPFEPVKETN
jgi:hypothetical protein